MLPVIKYTLLKVLLVYLSMEKEEIKKILKQEFDNKQVGPATRERIMTGPGLDWCANYIINCMQNDKVSFSGAQGHLESVLYEMGYGIR